MQKDENNTRISEPMDEPLISVGEDGVNEPQPTESAKSGAASAVRRDFLHLLCGGYLLYLAYQLGTGFLAEFPQTGWSVTLVVSAVGTVVFSIVGILLLVGCVKRLILRLKH